MQRFDPKYIIPGYFYECPTGIIYYLAIDSILNVRIVQNTNWLNGRLKHPRTQPPIKLSPNRLSLYYAADQLPPSKCRVRNYNINIVIIIIIICI